MGLLSQTLQFARRQKSCILHTILLLLVSMKIVVFNVEDSSYTRSMNRNWRYYFNPYGWSDSHNNVQLFTVNDTVRALNGMLSTYGQLSNISMADFSYRHSAGGYCQDTPTIISAETLFWQDSNNLNSYTTDITSPEDLDFITQNTQTYFASLDTLKLTMWLCNKHVVLNPYTVSGRPLHSRCYMWEVQILYRYVNQVYISVEINDQLNGACKGEETASMYAHSHSIWLETLSLVFGLAYLSVTVATLLRAWSYYGSIRRAHAQARVHYLHFSGDEGSSSNSRSRSNNNSSNNTPAQYEWNEIPFSVKRRFLPVWVMATLLGVVLAVADAAYRMYFRTEYIPTTASDKLMLGLSCLLLWGTVLQFLTFDPRVYAVAMTFAVAAPRILPYFVGVVPVYLSFVFLAIAVWGADLGIFSTFPSALKTLFALMMGDQMHDILSLMKLVSPTLTALFVLAFIVTTLYLVMNVVISIVEESYFTGKQRKRHLGTLIETRLAHMVDEQRGPFPETRTGAGAGREAVGETAQENTGDALAQLLAQDGSSGSSGIRGGGSHPLRLTPKEAVAEIYLLGRTHFEYSKVLDLLALKYLSGGEGQGEEEGEEEEEEEEEEG